MTGALLAAPGLQPQPTTHLAERLSWTVAGLLVLGLLVLLMRRGWGRRGAAQADLPPLPQPPADAGAELASAEGTYVSTTSEGDWLDRIVVHSLGVRSAAVLTVAAAGVLVERQGAPDIFIPAAAVRGVRLQRGMAGKFVEEGGLVVLTWQHGDRRLDSAFRNRYAADREALVSALGRVSGGGVR